MVTLIQQRSKSEKTMEPQTKITAPVTNTLDYFFEVLNRDQRTILTVYRDAERNLKLNESWSNFGEFSHCISGTYRNLKQINLYKLSDFLVHKFIKQFKTRSWGSRRKFNTYLKRLGEAFIIGVCLLTIVRVPVVMSAPSRNITTQKPTAQKTTTEKTTKSPDHVNKRSVNTRREISYANPCGYASDQGFNATFTTEERENDASICNRIIVRTQNALSYTKTFRDSYVQRTFKHSFDVQQERWENQKYDWLPNDSNVIPKKLGKNVDPNHLKSKTFNNYLVESYENLQKFSIALEQVVADMKKAREEFADNFRRTEIHIRNVLCEIQDGMIERDVKPNPVPPRTIMQDNVRNMSSTSSRHFRDFFILRDAMNGMEYVIEAFTYIKNNLQTKSS